MAVERSAFVYWEEYGVDDLGALERWQTLPCSACLCDPAWSEADGCSLYRLPWQSAVGVTTASLGRPGHAGSARCRRT